MGAGKPAESLSVSPERTYWEELVPREQKTLRVRAVRDAWESLGNRTLRVLFDAPFEGHKKELWQV